MLNLAKETIRHFWRRKKQKKTEENDPVVCLFVWHQTCDAMRRLLNNWSISRVLAAPCRNRWSASNAFERLGRWMLVDKAGGMRQYLLRFRESARWPTSQFIHFGLSQPVEPKIQFRARNIMVSNSFYPGCCCCIMWRTWRLFSSSSFDHRCARLFIQEVTNRGPV
jgi:hypothetical protein